jgi:hypothetical protein
LVAGTRRTDHRTQDIHPASKYTAWLDGLVLTENARYCRAWRGFVTSVAV